MSNRQTRLSLPRANRRAVVLAAFWAGLVSTGVASAEGWSFMDDRSSPQKLIQSYYHALSNRLYAQAYSYFAAGSAPEDFSAWKRGFAQTQTVQVKFGETAPDPGAGQIRWAVPVSLSARQSDGSDAVFAGCFTVQMISPGMQSDPPFIPMGIKKASLRQVNSAFEKTKPGPCS